jgi:dihydroorotate dehydrogenase
MLRTITRGALLGLYRAGWRGIARPLLFRMDVQTAHARLIRLLAFLDRMPRPLAAVRKLTAVHSPVTAGGVTLDAPLIVAAGFVKGLGFSDEGAVLAAVAQGVNIIPGWASVPALTGAVEFGSYTRYPRPGNPGRVLWRDAASRSTQNRVGLKNPGAEAAAAFLAARRDRMPTVYGINIAVSPGVADAAQERREAVEAFEAFVSRGLRPAWFTLNVSCPNTEDDPGAHQTETRTRDLCAAVRVVTAAVPLWVKVSPDLADEQYRVLLRVFAETGVRAVVATNTLGMPSPDAPDVMAGVGGGQLHGDALRVTRLLAGEIAAHGYPLEVIGCGGALNAAGVHAFAAAGAKAVQYYSALVFEGLLAGAVIGHDLRKF